MNNAIVDNVCGFSATILTSYLYIFPYYTLMQNRWPWDFDAGNQRTYISPLSETLQFVLLS